MLERSQSLGNVLGNELLRLLWSSSNKGAWVQEGVQLTPDWLEVLGVSDSLDQVVVTTLLLDNSRSLVGQHSDLLVTVLSGTTLLNHGHDNVLGGHEWQLGGDSSLNDLRVNNQTRGDVDHGGQQDVGGQEGGRKGNSSDSRVVQGSLEPLHRGGLDGIVQQATQVSGQRTHSLTSHWVSLVGHGGRTNLGLLKRLLNLLQVGQQTDVGGELVGGGSQRSQRTQDINVNLSGVSLASDRVDVLETKQVDHSLVQLLDLVVVTVEKGQERALGTGGTLDTTQTQIVSGSDHVSQIPQQLLDPQGGSLTNSGQLSRLEVGPAQNWQVLVLHGKLGQSVNDINQLWDQDIVSISQEDQIGVVGHETRGGTQVNDTGSGRTSLTENVHVGHDVVSNLGLLNSGSGDLLVSDLQMFFHLGNSLVRDDGKTNLLLGNGQVVPQLSPGGKSVSQRENLRHFLGGVPRGQWGGVGIVRHG